MYVVAGRGGGSVTDQGQLQLAGLPALGWLHQPAAATVADGQLSLTAGARTDWVTSPLTGDRSLNAPALVFPAAGQYVLSARVAVSFAGTFDAGVLVAHQDDQTWAKLCFEYSPQGRPMVVSVVTRGESDDCNSVEVDRDWVYLRLARTGDAFILHYSLDGTYWHFVRLFALGPAGTPTKTGFLAQSPMGEGVSVRFSEVSYEQRVIADIRSGE
jgi:regulation of enolase protein 1 (concanavalin A-like superfamily)